MPFSTNGMTRFQLITLLVFGAFIVLGVIIFSSTRGTGPGPNDNVLLWGTLPEQVIAKSIKDHPLLGSRKEVTVTYVQKSAVGFEQEIVEALAEGKGPDAVLLSQDAIWEHRNKIYPISYKTYSERQFKDAFIEEGELLLFPEGIMGVPILVDPIVMYWNRTLFSNAGISRPPQYWDEFFDLSTFLTKKDESLNIIKSTTALGEYRNVLNAKEILSALIMQAGSPITVRGENGMASVLNNRLNEAVIPAVAALNFYTEFSNPIKLFYSWNRSLPRSDNLFIAGDLALYFGFGSEFNLLKNRNPNLNFDAALFPQARSGQVNTTYGKMQSFVILKTAKNIPAAVQVAFAFAEPSVVKILSEETNLAPVRRDVLSTNPPNAHASIFYQSALRSRGWLDPENTSTGAAFQSMIESVTGGRFSSTEAVTRANAEITELFKNSQ